MEEKVPCEVRDVRTTRPQEDIRTRKNGEHTSQGHRDLLVGRRDQTKGSLGTQSRLFDDGDCS